MKLYKLEQDKVLEYVITRQSNEVSDYKRTVIEDKGATFYELRTSNQKLKEKIESGQEIDTGYYFRNDNGFLSDFILESGTTKVHTKILMDYIKELHINPSCIKFQNLRPKNYQQDYFLITKAPIEYQEDEYYIFPCMWKMPAELAGITLLEQERYYEFLNNKDLLDKFPSQLYQASQTNEYNASMLNMEIPEIKQAAQIIDAQGQILSKIKIKNL